MHITTGRAVTHGPPRHGHPPPCALASQAGVDVLRAGGSAVVQRWPPRPRWPWIYPHMTGLGGDAFGRSTTPGPARWCYLDGGGRAAAAGSIDWFSSRGHREVPFRGILPATFSTTPGAVASWGEAHATYGWLPMARCVQSAIGYARDGFPVTERLAGWDRPCEGRPGAARRERGDLPARRPGAACRQPPVQPGPGAHAGGGGQPGPGGLLRRRSRCRAGPLLGRARRLLHASRPVGTDRALGEPLHGRYRDVTLRNAGADTGLHRAADVEPARAVRAAPGPS